jgi:hypothetical protein
MSLMVPEMAVKKLLTSARLRFPILEQGSNIQRAFSVRPAILKRELDSGLSGLMGARHDQLANAKVPPLVRSCDKYCLSLFNLSPKMRRYRSASIAARTRDRSAFASRE